MLRKDAPHFVLWVALIIVFYPHVIRAETGKMQGAPNHEALAYPISEIIEPKVAPRDPPPPKKELNPISWDPRAQWIHGYWSWAPERNDFIWIKGIWRMPPPRMQWVAGFWSQMDRRWAWFPGFWSQVPSESLIYIPIAPPHAIEGVIGNPTKDNYFWRKGYWEYSKQYEQYNWVQGSWEKRDPKVVLIPAHYVRRPGGYVFIPPYWDWPTQLRGR